MATRQKIPAAPKNSRAHYFHPVLDRLEARVVPAQVMQPASLGAGSLVADLGNGQVGVWADNGAYQTLTPFAGYQGSLSVSTLSRSGFPKPDSIIIGTGPGAEPHVLVVSSDTGNVALSFFAFDPQFLGGVSVSGGVTRLGGNQTSVIVCGAGSGSAPAVSLFDAVTGQSKGAFYAFDPAYQGGVRVGLSMPLGDGTSYLVASSTINSHIVVFNLNQIASPLHSFYAGDPALALTGLYVASADLDNDGFLEVIAGAAQGPGSPGVRVLTLDGQSLKTFDAFASGFQGGSRVAVADINNDGRLDIVAGSGPGALGTINAFQYSDLSLISSRFINDNLAGVAPATNFAGGLLAGVIETPEEFRTALLRGEVREVAPEMIGLFYNSRPPAGRLGKFGRDVAWVGASDTLYDLLVLNQRYPLLRDRLPTGDFTSLNQEVIDALARIVGFPFTDYNTLGGWGLKFVVLRDPPPGLLDQQVPTLDDFFKLINAKRPDPTTMPVLPQAVLDILRQDYRQASLGNISPVEVFSQLSGMTVKRLIHTNVPRSGAYDLVTNPIPNPDTSPDVSDIVTFRIYNEANQAIGPLYSQLPQEPYGSATQSGIDNFFNNFAKTRIEDGSPQALLELAIGLRCVMAMSYDASPLWSSLGLGFADVANPFVGVSSALVDGIDIYAGQEFLVNNIFIPGDAVYLDGKVVIPYDQNPYLTRGFFQLDPQTILLPGLYDATPDNRYYQWNGAMFDTGSMVIFQPGSTSSDTVSAANIPSLPGPFNLHPTSTILVNGVATRLNQLPGLVNSHLPATFATYVSMAGGIDRVDGSPLSDVIVGSTGAGLSPSQLSVFSGRLTVSAGAGDDLVAPGRGGSLLSLGTGADQVVLGQGDLFGQGILLDFKGLTEGDRVLIDSAFTVDPSSWGTNLLKVIDPSTGFHKDLLLTGDSDLVWEQSFVTT